MSVLVPRSFRLSSAAVEVRLREDLLIEQHPCTTEIGQRQVIRRFGVGHFRYTPSISNRPPSRPSQPRFDLSGVCVRLLCLGADLDIGDSNQLAALAYAAAALDRRGDHASGDFSGHFRLFFGGKRAGYCDKSCNRTLDGCGGGNGDRADFGC